jgi:hypothetical protein
MDLRDAPDCICHESASGVAFRWLTNVDEMVGDPLSHRAGGLRGPDVEASVDESGVYADDLDGRFLGETNGPIALTHTRRPRQNEDGQ